MIISFIIPVYNTGKYLKRCVDSILNQGINKSSFEIIIIDDGSTDNSSEIIADLSKRESCIKKIICTENRGPGAARNAGIGIAQGKYIFFIDSDDYLFDNSLVQLFEYAESTISDIIGFDWAEIYSNGTIVTKKKPIDNTPMSGAEYLNGFNISGGVWAYLFSTSLLKKTSVLMPGGIYHEDELFLTEAFLYSDKIVFINQLVYAYFQRSESIINNKHKDQVNKRISDRIYVLDQLFYLEKKTNLSELQKRGLKRKIHFLAVDFIINLIRSGIDATIIKDRIQELKDRKLYPLPAMPYSSKYIFFRLIFNYRQNIIWASKLGLFSRANA